MNKKGYDISYCQKGLDLADVKKSGGEFVLIRAGIRTSTDTEFKNHIEGAIKNNIPYGFYWYSRAFTELDAIKEAQACIQTIKGYNPAYPVYYDIEEQDQIDGLTKAQRTNIIIAFCEEIKKAGYDPGIYLNPSWLENYVDKKQLLDKYDLWLAHWTEDPNVPSKCDYGQNVWQWGLDHIGKFDVDGDICFKDYPQKPQKEMPTVPDSPENDKMIPLGSVMQFSGGKQYGASTSDVGYPANAGLVRITHRAKGTPHPYHAISEDNSGVYGWVDESTLSYPKAPENSENEANTAQSETELKQGARVALSDVTLYAAADEKTSARRISGVYYLYDGVDVNGFTKICPQNNVGKTPVAANVTGWVKISDLEL